MAATLAGPGLLSGLRRAVWPLYLAGLAPAAWTFWLGLNDRLGVDPVRAFEHALGLWALRFLILALMVTPLRHLTGLSLIRYRRALGLLAFWYALMHVIVYAWLDKGLMWNVIGADLFRRPFTAIGFAAFLMLVALAVTSNAASIRKLGAEGWKRLHWLAYPALALAAIHFIMGVKAWPAEPVIYGVIAATLLALRASLRFLPKARPVRF